MNQPSRLLRGAACACFLTTAMAAADADSISLAGSWRYALDRDGTGEAERWFARDLPDSLQLPGTLAAQGIGDDVSVDTAWTGDILDPAYYTAPEYAAYRQPGNIKVPFFLQPEKHFVGAAWYQRGFDVPAAWAGSRVRLTLERPHGRTTVWCDDRLLGSHDSLSTPHAFDLGSQLAAGAHRLTIRVDNTVVLGVGVNAHSVTDHTQGNWNGIVGRMELEAGPPVTAEQVRVIADASARTIQVRGVLRNRSGTGASGKITVTIAAGTVAPPAGVLPVSTDFATAAEASPFTLAVELGRDARVWDEFSPATYRVHVAVAGEAGGRAFASDTRTDFGLRTISTAGSQLLINGRPLFLRGALDCAIYPATGHPPTGRAAWDKVMRTVKAYGLNHLRFHSWCPPEAAFAAADAGGVYLQIECAMWPNPEVVLGPASPHGLGDGAPVDAWAYAEAQRILDAYGNHPSFVMMALGNEPGGAHHAAFLSAWLREFRARDPRRLYTGASGWPELPENEFHVTSDPRIQHWGEGLASRINAQPPETRTDYREFVAARAVPVVSHEIGQWCVYPDFAEIARFTGYLKPRNFEIFRDSLVAHGLGGRAHDFLMASGRLQVLCYKEEIESALRTPHLGGFQLLGLQDFTGQGSALVGVVDAFWEPKPYVTADEYRRFCNRTVPLARLVRRVFTQDESLAATVDLAHYGAAPLRAAVRWRLVADDGRTVTQGTWAEREYPVGLDSVGSLSLPLAAVPAPARYRLVVELPGTPLANDWDLWVYPATPPASAVAAPGVMVTRDVGEALTRAAAGGTIVLTIPPEQVAPDPQRGKIELGFSSIFWNTAWSGRQAPHTLGILCDPRDPALAHFPTDAHSNWQWWYVVTHAAPMLCDGLPAGLRPAIAVVDDWFTNRRLALAFAARVGRGRLLVTSIDLDRADLDPVRRQLRTSFVAYAESPAFEPPVTVSPEAIRALVR